MDEATPDSAETRWLLQRIRGGDRQAFERLFAPHRAELRRFVEVRLDDKLRARVDASDVVQEAQLEAFRRLVDFLERQPMPFRLWLRMTAYEQLSKIRRRHLGTAKRSLHREVPLPDRSSLLLAQQLVAVGSTPSQRLSRLELAGRVGHALARLPETDREIVLMRNLERLPYQEISCLLGLDAAAARKRYGRALLRLRQILFDNSP